MNKVREIVDNYLNFAFFIDIAIIAAIFICNTYFPFINIVLKAKTEYLNILNSLIGAAVSLAGFILASLTIIVAIRSSIANKSPEQSKNPLELFFSLGTYNSIVQVFKIAIIELIISFVLGYIIWLISDNICNAQIFNSLVSIIFLLSVSTIRSLFVLFLLIGAEKQGSH